METQTRFELGQVVATPNVLKLVSMDDITNALRRHRNGDWGVLCDEDKQLNDEALKDGGRLLSAYESRRRVKFWIITEANREVTTVLLPEDY